MPSHTNGVNGIAARVARALSRKPTRSGRNWLVPCVTHDDRDPSLSLADGTDGRLVVRCFAGCDGTAIMRELNRRGLLEDRAEDPPRAVMMARPAPVVYWHTKDAPKETQRACAIWRTTCGPFPADSPAGRYLIGRGIPPPWPETLAFGRIYHSETRERVPALIVARQCPIVGAVRGIQRIFVTESGEKYDRGTAKMSFGAIEGGRAQLIRPDDKLVVAEGVETALSAWRLFRTPAWACCGPFPAEMILPPRVRSVRIVADNDRAGGSERRALALSKAISATGRRCDVLIPDEPGADANDVLRMRGAA